MHDAAAAATSATPSTSATATAAQPSPWRAALAVPKVVYLLCLASLWVAFAAAGAGAVALVVCDYDEACPVFRVLAGTTTKALISAAALAPIAPLLVVRNAVCDDGRFSVLLVINILLLRQAPRVPAGSMLREAVVQAFLAVFVFVLLGVIGCLVLVGLSPAKGSRTRSIGAMLIVVGEVGSMAISCFIIVPLLALKIWRIKLLEFLAAIMFETMMRREGIEFKGRKELHHLALNVAKVDGQTELIKVSLTALYSFLILIP